MEVIDNLRSAPYPSIVLVSMIRGFASRLSLMAVGVRLWPDLFEEQADRNRHTIKIIFFMLEKSLVRAVKIQYIQHPITGS
jgi:hypothetical protein